MSTPQRAVTPSAGRREIVALAALGVLGAWASAVPYLGPPLGLRVGFSDLVEVVDHVVPGILVVILSAWSVSQVAAGRVTRGTPSAVAAAATCVLAGFWITATHVGLLKNASEGLVGWGAAIFHASSGPPILLLAGVLLAAQLRADG